MYYKVLEDIYGLFYYYFFPDSQSKSPALEDFNIQKTDLSSQLEHSTNITGDYLP
jgi:hypothetical protein